MVSKKFSQLYENMDNDDFLKYMKLPLFCFCVKK